MSISTQMGTPQETSVSCDTALACLGLLSIQYGVDADIESDRDTLPLSRLIELAVGFGFRAQHVHGDWQWLKLAVTSHPVLLLLKNMNVIVAVGSRLGSREEIVVSDPLYRNGEIIILPREDLERAWDGEALTIIPLERWREISSEESTLNVSDEPSGRVDSVKIVRQPAKLTRRLVGGPAVTLVAGVGIALISATLLAAGLLTDWSTTAIRSSRAPAEQALAKTIQASVPINDIAVLSPITAGSLPNATLPPLSEPDATAASLPPVPPTISSAGAVPPQPLSTAVAVPLNVVPERVEAEPPTEPSPVWSSLPAAEIAALLAQGDEHLGRGDVASARLFYERVANAREAIAALRMGETFDPTFLSFAHLGGVSGNLETAISWYRRARDLGSSEAEIVLHQLGTK